jgi:hypothetical protein
LGGHDMHEIYDAIRHESTTYDTRRNETKQDDTR